MKLPLPIALLGFLVAHASLGWGDEERHPARTGNLQVPPPPHPPQRYAELWDSGWFEAPKPDESDLVEPVAEEAPFALRLVGVAALRRRQWVYLADEGGRVTELTFGRPAADLTLIRIEGSGTEGDPTVVVLRQGVRVIRLELSPPEARPAQPTAEGVAASARPPLRKDAATGRRPAWREEVFSKK